jgi:hypothetical protein
MLSLALKSVYGEYANTVLLSDGATWIRNMKDSIYPDAQQILDFYHFKAHVSDYAKLLYDSNKEKYISWLNDICHLDKYDSAESAIKALKKHITRD